MLRRREAIHVSCCTSLAVMLVLLWSFSVPAREVKFPTPSYEGKELAKIKERESIWVGKKVSTAELDQVKDLLPETIYTIMRNPKDFGGEGDMWFEVVQYREYKVSQGLIASTKQYAPTAQFDAT